MRNATKAVIGKTVDFFCWLSEAVAMEGCGCCLEMVLGVPCLRYGRWQHDEDAFVVYIYSAGPLLAFIFSFMGEGVGGILFGVITGLTLAGFIFLATKKPRAVDNSEEMKNDER